MSKLKTSLQRFISNIGKILIGDLNGLPHYFNKGHLMRTSENGYKNNEIMIGKFTFIGPYVTIGPNAKSIGNYCSIAQGSVIGGNIHPMNQLSTSAVFYAERWGKVNYSKDDFYNVKPTIIEHDVWLGSNAIIMPDVTLGTGCVVGAGAVVTKDVAPFEIVAGVPAKSLGFRFEKDKIDQVLDLKWWEMLVEDAFDLYKKFNANK